MREACPTPKDGRRRADLQIVSLEDPSIISGTGKRGPALKKSCHALVRYGWLGLSE